MGQAVKIGIIGAGISGLATAYYLLQESCHQNLEIEVTILERSDRLGGVIWNEKTEGFLLEGGPQNFVSFKPQLLELIKELGLGDEVMGSNDTASNLCPSGLQAPTPSPGYGVSLPSPYLALLVLFQFIQ